MRTLLPRITNSRQIPPPDRRTDPHLAVISRRRGVSILPSIPENFRKSPSLEATWRNTRAALESGKGLSITHEISAICLVSLTSSGLRRVVNRLREGTPMAMPSPPLSKRYVGRRATGMVINVTIDRDAVKLLRAYSDSPRSHGRFLSQLLYEHDRRQQFLDFLEKDGRKQLRRLCREVAREMRREEDA